MKIKVCSCYNQVSQSNIFLSTWSFDLYSAFSDDNIFIFGLMLESWIFMSHAVSSPLQGTKSDMNAAFY